MSRNISTATLWHFSTSLGSFEHRCLACFSCRLFFTNSSNPSLCVGVDLHLHDYLPELCFIASHAMIYNPEARLHISKEWSILTPVAKPFFDLCVTNVMRDCSPNLNYWLAQHFFSLVKAVNSVAWELLNQLPEWKQILGCQHRKGEEIQRFWGAEKGLTCQWHA